MLKRDRGGDAYLALSKGVEAVLLAPVVAVAAARAGVPAVAPLRAAGLVLGGALLTAANYLALSRAYRAGALAVVYPAARATALLALPLLGFALLGERIDATGTLAVLVILAGLGMLHAGGDAAHGCAAGLGWAFLAGLATAGYTLWDKVAVGELPVLAYFAAYTAVMAILLGALALRAHTVAGLRDEWRRHRRGIVLVACGNIAAYLLVLTALRQGTSTYVIAARQLSIVAGALLGWRWLGERLTRGAWAGLALLLAGCLLVAFAQ